MSSFPKYTVIIPVYNAEKTLQRCVDSLLCQNHSGLEMILVNDGSTDGSGELCREYANQSDCVVYIDKPNGGVSTARNAGLDRATGKYVLFVDSDDYVSEHYFETLDKIDEDFEFVMFSHSITDGKTVRDKILKSFSSKDADESVAKFSETLYRKTLTHPVTKRYLRQIIVDHSIRFPEHLYIGEDKTFNLRYVMHCKNCFISEESLYYVSVENENSLSRGHRSDFYKQLEMLTDQIQQELHTADIPEKYRQQYIAAENLIQLRAVYSEAKRMHLAGSDRKTRWHKIRRMCRDICEKKGVLPRDAFSVLLKIPVYFKMVFFIDLVGWKLAN